VGRRGASSSDDFRPDQGPSGIEVKGIKELYRRIANIEAQKLRYLLERNPRAGADALGQHFLGQQSEASHVLGGPASDEFDQSGMRGIERVVDRTELVQKPIGELFTVPSFAAEEGFQGRSQSPAVDLLW